MVPRPPCSRLDLVLVGHAAHPIWGRAVHKHDSMVGSDAGPGFRAPASDRPRMWSGETRSCEHNALRLRRWCAVPSTRRSVCKGCKAGSLVRSMVQGWERVQLPQICSGSVLVVSMTLRHRSSHWLSGCDGLSGSWSSVPSKGCGRSRVGRGCGARCGSVLLRPAQDEERGCCHDCCCCQDCSLP